MAMLARLATRLATSTTKSYFQFQSKTPLVFRINTAIKMSDLAPFKEDQIVPDVIDAPPLHSAQIIYNGMPVDMGCQLTPTEVQNKPNTIKYPTEEGALYTLCMTDPDAPSRSNPTFREWHHWLVVNIPGTDVAAGTTMSDYIGAGPPEGTGLHRYVYLIYKQPNKLNCDEEKLTNRSGDGRANFKIKDFALKYKLGEPIAGNFFQAEWDDYVPTLYKQLSG